MIENVKDLFYTNFKPKAQVKAQSASAVTVPEYKTESYSANNVKAKYMPVSFGAKYNFLSRAIDDSNNVVMVSALPEKEKYKGEYYNSFADDVAITIGSNKNLILTSREGVDSEIFAHNLADRISQGKYDGMGLDKDLTSVFYIDNPIKLSDGKSVMESLNIFNKVYPKSVVVMNKFENFIESVRGDMILNMGSVANRFYTVDTYLQEIFPKINFVGVVDKELMENKESYVYQNLHTMSKLDIKGLNTAQTKEFFKKNPGYIEEYLNRYDAAKLRIGDNAMSNLVEKSAVKLDMALPKAATTVLDRLTVAKINETDLKHRVSVKPLSITTHDVDAFFEKHNAVIEEYKPQNGRFSLAENISTKLSDVGGISSIKQDIEDDLIAYLKKPEKFIKERGVAPKGVLLEGPPGTGKTLLARAIAGETNTPFISATGSEFVEKYVGVGAQRIRELFKTARDAAENSPSHTAIVFIDEFDALAGSRSRDGGGNREAEQTLNQLLTEMDGFNNKEAKNRVVVIAATNRKDMLDSAAIRPGRFDDVFKVDNPRTTQDRLEIMNIHAKKLPFASPEDKEKILNDTAKLAEGMSGAELAGLMNRAKRIVAKRDDNKVVTYNDMVEAYLQTIAGPVQKSTDDRPMEDIIETVRHEGGHATLTDCLQPLLGDKISFITLDQRGNFLGAVFRKPSQASPNIRSVILSAAVGYAGGMAEPAYDNNGRSAGVSQDVSQATRLLRKAITEWGQGVYTPPITMVPNERENDAQSNAFYDTLRASNEKNIAKDVALFSATAGAIAGMVNEFHKGFLDEYVDMFKANAGKGGNNLTGEQFSKLRHDWIVKNGKEEAEKKLLSRIDKMLTKVMNKNNSLFKRIVKHFSKTL